MLNKERQAETEAQQSTIADSLPSAPLAAIPMLAAGKMKFREFQSSCSKCYEIIYQGKFFVKIDEKGEPLRSECKRVFNNPYFKERIRCGCCGSREFNYSYLYTQLQKSEDAKAVIDDDLPF